MDFNTMERLILLTILPAQGDLTTVRLVRQLREALSFSEAEHKALQFEQLDDGRMIWKIEGDKPKKIEIGAKARELIVKALQKLSDDGTMRDEHIVLADRFDME